MASGRLTLLAALQHRPHRRGREAGSSTPLAPEDVPDPDMLPTRGCRDTSRCIASLPNTGEVLYARAPAGQRGEAISLRGGVPEAPEVHRISVTSTHRPPGCEIPLRQHRTARSPSTSTAVARRRTWSSAMTPTPAIVKRSEVRSKSGRLEALVVAGNASIHPGRGRPPASRSVSKDRIVRERWLSSTNGRTHRCAVPESEFLPTKSRKYLPDRGGAQELEQDVVAN